MSGEEEEETGRQTKWVVNFGGGWNETIIAEDMRLTDMTAFFYDKDKQVIAAIPRERVVVVKKAQEDRLEEGYNTLKRMHVDLTGAFVELHKKKSPRIWVYRRKWWQRKVRKVPGSLVFNYSGGNYGHGGRPGKDYEVVIE